MKEHKRVLFWSGTFWPNIGGVEVLAAGLLPALRSRGYEYTIVAPKREAELPDDGQYKGIPMRRLAFGNNPTGSIDHVLGVKQQVATLKRTFAPHLIHINAVGVEDLFHLTTTNAHRAPVLVTLHGKWPSRADAIVEQLLRSADWVVGCSAVMLEEGRKLAPEITPRSSVIYNAIESPRVLASPLPFNPPRCLCLGRLASDKGFDVAISAFRSVVDQIPDARLTIAGDGPERTALQRQAIEMGIGHAVDFLGWVAPRSVPDLINSSTMVTIPSREESFGLVALEAAFMARPVVASRVGGLCETVTDGKSGLLVEKEDAEGLANAIIFLMNHPSTAEHMGQSAFTSVPTAFSWKTHVDSYDTLYRQMTQGQLPAVTAKTASL